MSSRWHPGARSLRAHLPQLGPDATALSGLEEWIAGTLGVLGFDANVTILVVGSVMRKLPQSRREVGQGAALRVD